MRKTNHLHFLLCKATNDIGRVFSFALTYAYNIEILTKIMSMSDITSSCCHAEVPASNSSPDTDQ